MGSKSFLLPAALAALLTLAPLLVAGAEDEARPQADPATIDRLIRELGADEFPTRERASRELVAIGEPARSALQRAMQSSENMETRWRAEQILKRLDQQGARPLPPPARGAEPQAELGEPAEPGDALSEEAEARLAALERHFEEMRRLMSRNDELFGGRLFGRGMARETLRSEGLALDVDTFGFSPNLTLHVTAQGKPPVTYRGRSLEAIVEQNPELREHPGMPALQERWAEYKRMHPATFAFEDLFGRDRGSQSSSQYLLQGAGQSIRVTQDGNGVRVEVKETDANGETTTKTYEGESLEAIQRENPALKEKLGGWRMGPTVVFGNRPPWRRMNPGGRPPARVPRAAEDGFGVEVGGPGPVLASQLKLVEEQALLVVRVVPGSQADAMGLQRYDIIVAIDDRPVESRDAGMLLLRRAAQTNAPMALDVIRQGERMRLTR